jgi:hypothetical protein
MENHPIPQDITGFQFKLVGNMTVKQFAYLAIGAILAWLFFFILNLPTILKWPLAVLSLGSGASLAFVPIDGRPMDTMIGNFMRALLSPTQFIYQRGSRQNQPSYIVPNVPAASTKPQAQILERAIPQPQTQPANPVQNLVATTLVPQTPTAPTAPSVVQLSSPQVATQPASNASYSDPTKVPARLITEMSEPDEEQKKKEEIEKGEREYLQNQIDDLQKQLGDSKTQQPIPAPAPVTEATSPNPQQELERLLAESNRQKEALEKQILQMSAKMETNSQPTFNPVVAKPLAPTQHVRRVPLGMEKTVGIPSIPDAPNLITGIIKDPRGNPLPNILVEVKDQDSNPVRAFKTNGLGKFASATSLSNGKYLISFEDPGEKNQFDAFELELTGAIVMPLEIISVDPREELRRELFN